jgi:transcriptional regulator GlxA family with amidase domain
MAATETTEGFGPFLGEVAEELGAEAALRLAKRLGSREVYVPTVATEGHPLTDTLGVSGATWFCRMYGGTKITIPAACRTMRLMRDRSIRQKRAAGATVRALASEHGMSERQMWRIVGEDELSVGSP